MCYILSNHFSLKLHFWNPSKKLGSKILNNYNTRLSIKLTMLMHITMLYCVLTLKDKYNVFFCLFIVHIPKYVNSANLVIF